MPDLIFQTALEEQKANCLFRKSLTKKLSREEINSLVGSIKNGLVFQDESVLNDQTLSNFLELNPEIAKEYIAFYFLASSELPGLLCRFDLSVALVDLVRIYIQQKKYPADFISNFARSSINQIQSITNDQNKTRKTRLFCKFFSVLAQDEEIALDIRSDLLTSFCKSSKIKEANDLLSLIS